MENTAMITSEGDIKFPTDSLKRYGLREGAKFFFEYKDGNLVLYNANIKAWDEVQKAFVGEAERVGWQDEDDVIEYCNQLRKKLWKERYENNA